IHYLSFPLYVIASVHLFTAGTDAGNAVAVGTVVVVSGLIAVLTVVRIVAASMPRRPSSRIPAAARVAPPGAVTPLVVTPAPDAVRPDPIRPRPANPGAVVPVGGRSD